MDPKNWTTGETTFQQVALAAIKGDRTISEVAAHFRIHVNLAAHGKKQLVEGAARVFTPGGKGLPPPDDPKEAELRWSGLCPGSQDHGRFGGGGAPDGGTGESGRNGGQLK